MRQTIAVTGGAGYLGSHVTEYFLDQGVETVVVDDLSEGSAENLPTDHELLELREHDLIQNESTRAFKDVDVIVHLAAKIGGIGYFHEVPADILALNDSMTRTVLDAAREHDLDRVVYASSSMVFENATEFPVSEDQLGDIAPPDSAYGYQKLSGEYYCRAYADQYDVEYSIFRPFNALGPREPPGDEIGTAHIIPDMCKKIMDERQHPVNILGSGQQIRSFTHTKDIAQGAYLCATEPAAANEDFNVGNENGVTMEQVTREIWNRADRDEEFELNHVDAFEHDVQKRVPCSDKIRDLLGWEQEYDFGESLDDYIDWYVENHL